MRRWTPLASFLALVTTLIVVGTTGASGSTGQAVKLGRHNCSGTLNDAACSGGSRTTSIDWDTTSFPVPDGTLVVKGFAPTIVAATSEDYASQGISPGLTAVEGYGSDFGGFFWGVDGGVWGQGDYGGPGVTGVGPTGVEADGSSFDGGTGIGVDATARDAGGIAVRASGPNALVATGRVTFSTAGLAVVPQGATSVTVSPGVGIHPGSKILATVQSTGGVLARVLRNTDTDRIIVQLQAPATAPVTVAYFVME